MIILKILMGPLIGFLGASIFSRFITKNMAYMFLVFFIIKTFVLSGQLLKYIIKDGLVHKINLGSWIVSEGLEINWIIYIDSLTAIMLVVVSGISFFVHVYSSIYMQEDPNLIRFLTYLSLFTFFMLILITAGNVLQMFIGWEGVGLCSFLLINFWFTRIQANKAAIKAMLVNRVGDFFLLLAIFLIFYCFRTLDYDIIFSLAPFYKNMYIIIGDSYMLPCLDLICLCLFFGAVGKSAQLGLHTWLPDAMEGPTPVSALIHAATMVTAGVFLIARCSILFEYSENILHLVIIIGSITAFFAGTVGLFQNDIKRVIAYSTCSQLGYMIFACGLSSYDVGVFHLYNHAFFKALLFLGAGSVIHSLADEQDIRRMGGLKNVLPFSYSIFLIGSLALIGFPFLSGFYSKDIILESAYAHYSIYGHFAFILGILGAFCTAFYSTRLFFLVFLANYNGYKKILVSIHESGVRIGLVLILLTLASIFVGFKYSELFIGFGTHFWGSSIYILPNNYTLSSIEFINIFYKLLPLILTILGVLMAISIYCFNLNSFFSIKMNNWFRKIYYFLMKKWYFDRIYNQYISQNILYSGLSYTYKNIDRGIIELEGPTSIIKTLNSLSINIKELQSGFLFHYLFYILFALFAIILFYILIVIYPILSLEILFFMGLYCIYKYI